jgi:antitoxin component HigA of HigAB toxin-antitoxin module
MAVECAHDPKLRELCSRFPLRPIEDRDSYRAALEILDHLFDRDERQTRAESRYFRALAEIVFEYEIKQKSVTPHM